VGSDLDLFEQADRKAEEDIDEMRRRAEARPSLGADSVSLVREMRDEDP
jgi:hypothetical protein